MTDRKGTRSYQRNFKIKRRRRREGKTDYKQRVNMLRQDVNKFGAMKSRLVVRITNTKVICQIIKAHMDGDRVVAQADSTELKNFGVTFGLTNYFAAYATGMLCGRRALAANDLDKQFVTKTDVGAFEETESPIEERRAYKVFQDIGLARATKGAKVFIAMKGASDSGLFIPHSPSKFVGWDGEDLQAEELANRIFMKENCSYMEHLKENDEEKYKLQFGGYVAKKIEPGSIEAIYKNALKKIGAEGAKVEKKKAEYSGKKYENKKKISLAERKERVAARLAEE